MRLRLPPWRPSSKDVAAEGPPARVAEAEMCRSSRRSPARRAGNTVTVSNVSGTALANVGSAALVQAGGNNILVLQAAQGSFKAFTAVCTHEQNIITGFQNNSTFVCPAHGSQFNTSGGVVQGPATRALREFSTQFTNNVLTITV